MQKAITVILLLIFPLFLKAQNDSIKRSNLNLDIGMSSNLDGKSGFHTGIGIYSYPIAVQFDYSGIRDKDGLYYHEFGPRIGLCFIENFLNISISTGLTICIFKDQKDNFLLVDNDLFMGIPAQIRLEFLAKRPFGLGLKLAHHFSLQDKMNDLSTLSFYISFRLEKK